MLVPTVFDAYSRDDDLLYRDTGGRRPGLLTCERAVPGNLMDEIPAVVLGAVVRRIGEAIHSERIQPNPRRLQPRVRHMEPPFIVLRDPRPL